ncbi:MAG: hypothetical protein E6K95_10065 [Thaumarchaeota archaeon]|nr:MAG: hypothetical protein E6K95_10065 [Nitrososphaerota archaeon]
MRARLDSNTWHPPFLPGGMVLTARRHNAFEGRRQRFRQFRQFQMVAKGNREKLRPAREAEEHAGHLQTPTVEILNKEHRTGQAGRPHAERFREFAALSSVKQLQELKIAE